MKWLVLASSLAACGAPRSAPVRSHVDRAIGDEPRALIASGLAIPPHQLDPWHPDATPLGSAIATLFAQGVADPRGLSYRAVELDVGGEYGAKNVATHAWVFAGDKLAVAWNGLVYPVSRVGRAQDVRADCALVLRLAQPDRVASTEAESVDVTKPNPVAVALLTRLGEGELATQLWAAMHGDGDGYLAMSRAWIYRLYDRALLASNRGDRAIANASLRALEVAVPVVEAEAKHRGLAAPYLASLDDLPRLIAQDRRRATPRAALPTAVALAALPDLERLDVLIDHLDEAELVQQSALTWSDGVFVPALVRIGEPAIPKLLDVIASDPRLSRGAATDDGHAVPLGVEVAAQDALEEILDHHFFDFPAVADRTQLAAKIRAYWDSVRAQPIEERWYSLLADDHADSNDQVMAALSIASRGGVLRSHAAPTVSDLLVRRIELLSNIHDACYVAGALEQWDAQAAAPSLGKLMARAIREAGTIDRDGECIGQLAEMRDANGDHAAIDEYARWIEQTVPDPQAQFTLMFGTLPKFLARKSVRRAVDVLFAAGSPWLPLVDPRGGHWDLSDLVETKLLQVPALNQEVVVELGDAQVYASLEMTERRRFFVKPVVGGGGLDSIIHPDAPFVPPIATTQSVRVCDWIAHQLQLASGSPPSFELYWTLARRDTAIRALTKWVVAQRRP